MLNYITVLDIYAFKCLGMLITSNRKCSSEIKTRICQSNNFHKNDQKNITYCIYLTETECQKVNHGQ